MCEGTRFHPRWLMKREVNGAWEFIAVVQLDHDGDNPLCAVCCAEGHASEVAAVQHGEGLFVVCPSEVN